MALRLVTDRECERWWNGCLLCMLERTVEQRQDPGTFLRRYAEHLRDAFKHFARRTPHAAFDLLQRRHSTTDALGKHSLRKSQSGSVVLEPLPECEIVWSRRHRYCRCVSGNCRHELISAIVCTHHNSTNSRRKQLGCRYRPYQRTAKAIPSSGKWCLENPRVERAVKHR